MSDGICPQCLCSGLVDKVAMFLRQRCCVSPTARTLNKTDQGTAYDECSTIQQQRQKNPNGVLSLEEISQLLGASWQYWTPATLEVTTFHPDGTDKYIGYGFICPAHKTSGIITIRGLAKSLAYHNTASDQGTHFTAKEVCQWAHGHATHCFYHLPHYPEADDLREY